jgi:hypothetical protein
VRASVALARRVPAPAVPPQPDQAAARHASAAAASIASNGR